MAMRAKIVLACAESDVVYARLARELGVSTMTVIGVFPKKWRRDLCREFVDVSES